MCGKPPALRDGTIFFSESRDRKGKPFRTSGGKAVIEPAGNFSEPNDHDPVATAIFRGTDLI